MAFGIILTHKVAGPMYSLIKYLRLIEAGKWAIHMKQRQGDDLQIIVRHVNEMSEGLVLTVQKDLEQLGKVKSKILNPTGEIGESDFLLSSIDRLMENMKLRIHVNQPDSSLRK